MQIIVRCCMLFVLCGCLVNTTDEGVDVSTSEHAFGGLSVSSFEMAEARLVLSAANQLWGDPSCDMVIFWFVHSPSEEVLIDYEWEVWPGGDVVVYHDSYGFVYVYINAYEDSASIRTRLVCGITQVYYCVNSKEYEEMYLELLDAVEGGS